MTPEERIKREQDIRRYDEIESLLKDLKQFEPERNYRLHVDKSGNMFLLTRIGSTVEFGILNKNIKNMINDTIEGAIRTMTANLLEEQQKL